MATSKYSLIGKRVPYIDSVDKVTGTAVFGTDVVLPGMLHGKILRSPHAHARILSIRTDKAMRYPGVRAVVTAKDAPNTHFGLSIRDERFFASDEVQYIGDEVAAVVAINEKTACEALKLIEVDYEPLPPVFDPWGALQPGTSLARGDTHSNLAFHAEVTRGDIEKGFRESAVVLEETFYTEYQYQAYLEPHVSVAQWRSGRLTVWAPHQAPSELEEVISIAFDLPRGGFQFIQTYVGGGFGGKTHLRVIPFSALLARIVNAPVRLALDREEDFQTTYPAVAFKIHLKMGVNSDGILTAKEMHFMGDNGAFTVDSLGVMAVAVVRVDNLYRYTNVFNTADLVYTNKIATSAFRGYGNTQTNYAVEQMLDMLAEKINMDPAELRLRNAIRAGDITIHGKQIDSSGLVDALQTAVQETNWRERHAKFRGKGRGLGLACGLHGSGAHNLKPQGTAALVRVHEGGMVHVATGEGDIGQGNSTVYAIIAAEELGVPLERVVVDTLDTDVTNFGIGSTSSRGTVLGGHGVRAAAIAVRKRLMETAAKKWHCDLSEIQFSKGVFFNTATEESIEIGDLAAYYTEITGGSRALGEALYIPTGLVVPGADRYGEDTLGYGFGVHVAEVEVDLETGQVNVLKYLAVHDAGQVINLLGVEGQVQGGILQGIGFALKEEMILSEGKILNPDFKNYNLPTMKDAPEMKVLFTNTIEPKGPYGAKSIGEVAMVPVAPAIANAIYDATGVRLTSLPMTPERVFLALKSHRHSES